MPEQNNYTIVKNPIYRYDTHADQKILHHKKKGHLPAMGWNSWNAFGSGNTEELTKKMADAFLSLGLKDIGYEYVILDDGCYKPERVDGKLSNETVKFPGGFKALANYMHDRGLKFGMYNDIGTNLCAGAAVGTYGHEKTDAASYLEWTVDFLKVDNCYNLWDNATFSDAANAKYVYTPNIRSVTLSGKGIERKYNAVSDGILTGTRAEKKENYVTNIGTFDGTGPAHTPIGDQSSELHFEVEVQEEGTYELILEYAAGEEEGVGSWLQIAVGEEGYIYNEMVPATETTETFTELAPVKVDLKAGSNLIRVMNHRRQENTLTSYGTLTEALYELDPEHDVILSLCEWGKTQPQNWGYKVGDSWRILNDITFQVGADQDPGVASWSGDYTNNLTAQYNKCVIMDEFAGLDKGWNDPDMMMIGMDGLNEIQNRTHMVMWCMMNSPLMLGLDLRRVKKGDAIWKIIANGRLIALNQDPLGIQAKRVFCKVGNEEIAHPDIAYIRDIDRVDILAKPLSDGSVALSFINVSEEDKEGNLVVTAEQIKAAIGSKMVHAKEFANAVSFTVEDLWTGECRINSNGLFGIRRLTACDNVTIKVTPNV